MESLVDLIDSHCHLQDERFAEGSLGPLLATATAAGVSRFVVNGCWQEDWGRVLRLGASHPGTVIPQLGLHPWWVGKRSTDWLQLLRRLLLQHPEAGLGECGLDRSAKAIEASTWEDQLEAFEAQLRLAEELQRPVSVHCVRSFGAVHDALRAAQLTVPVVLHAWNGSAGMAATFMQLPNVYFSLGGHTADVSPQKALQMLRSLPLERCLLESDAPDGTLRLSDAWVEVLPALADLKKAQAEAAAGQPPNAHNTPASVPQVLDFIAAAMMRSREEIAAAACRNALRIFCSSLACCKDAE